MAVTTAVGGPGHSTKAKPEAAITIAKPAMARFSFILLPDLSADKVFTLAFPDLSQHARAFARNQLAAHRYPPTTSSVAGGCRFMQRIRKKSLLRDWVPAQNSRLVSQIRDGACPNAEPGFHLLKGGLY